VSQFAIIVTIKIKPGTRDKFLPLILQNAEAAVRDEPGCHQFQVLTGEDDPDTMVFYEVYDNPEALDTHREQPHFKTFIEGTKDMIIDRNVQRCTVIKS
jgi:autoinducer 2-degrading protein